MESEQIDYFTFDRMETKHRLALSDGKYWLGLKTFFSTITVKAKVGWSLLRRNLSIYGNCISVKITTLTYTVD